MKDSEGSRRQFLKATGLTAGAWLLSPGGSFAWAGMSTCRTGTMDAPGESAAADYTLHIKTSPVEIAEIGRASCRERVWIPV